jgi:hypothetical protein
VVVRSVLLALLLGSSANAGAMISAASQEPPTNSMSAAGVESRAAEIEPGWPGWPVPHGSRPFVLHFEPGSAEPDEAIARTVDSAIASYRETGFAWLRFDDPAGASELTRPELSRRRAATVRDYLEAQGIWSVPLRQQGGEWLAASWDDETDGGSVDGLALMGLGTMMGGSEDSLPVPPPPPVPVPPPPMPVPPPPDRAGHASQRPAMPAVLRVGTPAPSQGAPPQDLAAVGVWLTATGTLTSKALQSLVAACLRREGELTADCQAAVTAGAGEFAVVPEDARAEFSLLLTGCRTLREGRSCAEAVAMEREFRALPRGRLDPQPLAMQEGVKTTFIARIVYEGDRTGGGRPGVPIGETRPAGTGGSSQSTVVPFSGQMCFTLSADAKDFLIRQITEHCPEISEGSSRVKYDPQWEVTPLRSGKLELKLKTELFVADEKKEFRHEPYPLIIDVAPKPSLWDKLDATIKRATGTTNLAVDLVKAIGALITAIAGLGIWAWFRKRRRKRREAPPAG